MKPIHLSRLRFALLGLARHLQLIILLLFVLYLLGLVAVLTAANRLDSPGAAIGAMILVVFPAPLFACESLAVVLRWVPAAYLCAMLWLLIAVWMLLTPFAVVANGRSGTSFISVSLVYCAVGCFSALLAFLHKLWPQLLPPRKV